MSRIINVYSNLFFTQQGLNNIRVNQVSRTIDFHFQDNQSSSPVNTYSAKWTGNAYVCIHLNAYVYHYVCLYVFIHVLHMFCHPVSTCCARRTIHTMYERIYMSAPAYACMHLFMYVCIHVCVDVYKYSLLHLGCHFFNLKSQSMV